MYETFCDRFTRHITPHIGYKFYVTYIIPDHPHGVNKISDIADKSCGFLKVTEKDRELQFNSSNVEQNKTKSCIERVTAILKE
jgi:hypothetical protein